MQKGNRRTVGQWGKSETGWGQSWQGRPQGRAHQGGRSVASAFNVAGPELIRSRVRVNPSEQQQEADQQEGHGRGRKEREKRVGSKRAAKGASSGLPGRAPNCIEYWHEWYTCSTLLVQLYLIF